MGLFWNTLFWAFFFMMGFVATVELIADVGPQLVKRYTGATVRAVWLVVVYAGGLMLMIRMLRLFGSTYTWTANALRNAMIIYLAVKLKDCRAYVAFLLVTFISYWPFWNWSAWATAGFAATLLVAVVVNRHQRWWTGHPWRLHAVSFSMTVLFWLFDMASYAYPASETGLVIGCGYLVLLAAHGYDNLLAYRRNRLRDLVYDTQHDVLTHAFSRTKFNADLGRWLPLRVSGQAPAIHLVMVDLDHFKSVNDTYGHLAGDTVLQQFTALWQNYLETVAFPCDFYRTGGEEFSLIVAGGAKSHQVEALVAAFMSQLRQHEFDSDGQTIVIAMSAGITSVRCNDKTIDDVIARADAQLYAAKRAGRDRLHSDG